MESFFREHARRLDDFLWLLAPASQPELRSLTVGDGFTSFPSREDWAPLADDAPLMLLLHREDRPQAIDSLVLILPAAERGWTKALSSERHGYAATLELLPGAVDSDWVLLSAIATPGAPTDALYPFIGRIFARFLVSGRPLRAYDGSFMLPLDLRLDDELHRAVGDIPALGIIEGESVERFRLASPASSKGQPDDLLADYLSTPLQQRLFEHEIPTGDAADIIHWRIPVDRCRDWTLQVIDKGGQGYADEAVTQAKLDDVSLYQYYNGLFLLVLRVSMPPPAASATDDGDWWQALLFSDTDAWTAIDAAQIARWLRFSAGLRRLYASVGIDTVTGPAGLLRLADGAQTLAEMPPDSAFSEVISFLLREFMPALPERQLQRGQRLRQIAGAQMFTHTAYTLQGPEPHDDDGHDDYRRLFGRALHGGCSDTWPASGPDQRNSSGFTALGNAFIGSDCDQRYAGFIAPLEIPVLYAGLQIPVLFLCASLDLFERRVAAAVGELHRDGRIRRNTLSLLRPTAFGPVHADFIEFTGRHWPPSLSAKARGAEAAARMMAAQDLQERYRRMADKMTLTNEYVASLDRANRRQSFRWLVWAGLVAGIALVLVVALG